jgi:dTDP-4-amino-4,6-dideoxygalactose transaminase
MKRTLTDLAAFGGEPAFREKLHVGRPNIGDRRRLLERINDALDRRWLTNGGRYVQELEHRVADLLGVRHCIAICNGTVALEILVMAAGLSGEVVVPSFTFVATVHALRWLGIRPRFCDVDVESHNLDPRCVREAITPRTTGIIGVHVWGRACDVEALSDIARQQGLSLLFDAAHAFGCSYKGQMVGNFGDAEVFSFHATKFFNTFEGGAVTTNDSELASRVRLMRDFGFAGPDSVVSLGTNGKMSEVSAAMGLTGLESLQEFIDINRRNHDCYRHHLADTPGIGLVPIDGAERHNYQYVVVEVDEEIAGIGRDHLVELLHSENVLARRYFHPGCHRMEPYASEHADSGRTLPVTEALSARVLCLPTGTAVTAQDIASICEVIRIAVEHGEKLSALLDHLGHARSQN